MREAITLEAVRDAAHKRGKGVAIVAKYAGECGWCGQALIAGDPVLYLPADKAIVCGPCALDEGTEP